MNESIEIPATASKTPEELAGLKNVTMAVYALQALSFIWGLPAIVGVIKGWLKLTEGKPVYPA